jgi:hypothetical protein
MQKKTYKNLLNNKRTRTKTQHKKSSSTSSTTNESDISNSHSYSNTSLFKKNPNLKFKQNIVESNNSNGFNDLFEVYHSKKDNCQYLVSPNSLNHNLDIISVNNNKLISSLKGHKNSITMVRYFTGDKKKEYLISADISPAVIIWDISDKKVIYYKIKLQYKNWIYSCCILVLNDYDYAITSCCGEGNTKVYFLKNKKATFLRNIYGSKNYNVYYMMTWYNVKDKNYYLIEFCKRKIVINNIEQDIVYTIFGENESGFSYMNGFMYTPEMNTDNNYKDYLFSISNNGYIYIWDLYEKNLVFSIFINNCLINNIIQWNKNIIILSDLHKNSIKIMLIDYGIVISDIYSQHDVGILYIKKTFHPIYGESLLSSGQDGSIKLWTI